MTQERPIWRPNAIAPNIWEAMTRDEQIAWWKSRPKEQPKLKRHMKEAIALYKKGVYTDHGFVFLVFELAASDEIDEFMSVCPADLLSLLRESLACYGNDESTWPRFFASGCYAPWVTQEEIAESIRQQQQQLWDGVRLLKQWDQAQASRDT